MSKFLLVLAAAAIVSSSLFASTAQAKVKGVKLHKVHKVHHHVHHHVKHHRKVV